MNIHERLAEVSKQIDANETPQPVGVRELLSWVNAQRRGYYIVWEIRQALAKANLRTDPDFNSVWIDAEVRFVRQPESKPTEPADGEAEPDSQDELPASPAADPTYRISRLPAANNRPVSVKPDDTVETAVTVMLSKDFSQLPVMQSDREVKGIVSWESLGKRLALGKSCDVVRTCMDEPIVVPADTYIFQAVDQIVKSEYVLVRGEDNIITGIVTTADLSVQFKDLGEPFLLLGEIENYIRMMISEKFTKSELNDVKDPEDSTRDIQSPSDMTFGEYVRLLQNPQKWDKFGLKLDRKIFIDDLDRIREIRNDVMHFDPDGIPDNDLKLLRDFIQMMHSLHALGAI